MSKSLLLRYVLAGVAIAAAIESAVLGVASFLFHRGDRALVELAARLVPFNSEYLSRLSSYYPDRRTELLLKAASFNPSSEQVWIQLGFDAEFRHFDPAAAEKYYLKAAAVSRLFLPRWTLANFYFRRQRKPEFLKWARAALDITPYTPDPIFTEMWLMDSDRASLAAVLPNRPYILEHYFLFLMNAREFAFVPPIVKRLVNAAPSAQAGLYGVNSVIGPSLDTLLGAGKLQEAMLIWSDLSAAHWIPLATPGPARPLTNGDFGPMYGHGFDWFLPGNPGTTLSHPDREIEIDLSGEQPENYAVLLQWLPLGPSREYRLQWKMESTGLTEPAGLAWRLRTSKSDLKSPDLLADHPDGWRFQTPADAHLGFLTLEFKRPAGYTKAQGTVRLQSVSLQPD